MSKITTGADKLEFEITFLEAVNPTHAVLFAVGSGGNPERHLPLLTSLVDCGCSVIAPHFDRIVSPRPTTEDVLLRARALHSAVHFISIQNLPLVGVGHSIGAALLLALAGGQLWMSAGECLSILPVRLERLALLAPATDFFRAPGALGGVRIPIQVWEGTNDVITPPTQAEFLKSSLGSQVPVEMRVINGAGHFSFMNTLPPLVVDPLVDREQFLNTLATDVSRFVTGAALR